MSDAAAHVLRYWPILIFLLMQAVAATWWASAVSSDIRALSQEISKVETSVRTLNETQTIDNRALVLLGARIDAINDRLSRIERTVNETHRGVQR